MSEDSSKVVVTLKAGPGFESPWIVIHAESVADAKAQINQGEFAELAERTVAAAEFFRAAHNVKGGLAANEPPQQQAPPAQQGSWSQQGSGQQQQQQAAPAAEGRRCAHGEMQYRESKPGAAKAWRAYFCPTAKGTPNQCEPVWLKG